MELGDGRERTFLKLTSAQLNRLLAVVDKSDKRNWDWLITWIDGTDPLTCAASIDDVLKLYEDDQAWIHWA